MIPLQTLHVLSQVVAVLFAAHAIWILWWIRSAAGALRRAADSAGAEPLTDPPTIVVLLPALREQRLVRETMELFATARYPGTLVPVVITSERESVERDRQEALLPEVAARLSGLPSRAARHRAVSSVLTPSVVADTLDELDRAESEEYLAILRRAFDAVPTTAALCAQVVLELNARTGTHRCHHLHYSETGGRKGAQLNYAVERMATIAPETVARPEATYVAVYDFDAVPHEQTFVAAARQVRAAEAAGRRPPALLQQVQLPLRFRAPFAPGVDGLLMRGQVLYWLRRGLAIEVGRLLQQALWRRIPRVGRVLTAPLRPMIYAIGSGLFVNMAVWRELGPFPEMQESVGHRASLLGHEIALIPNFNLTEPYYQARSMTNGWANVCYGSLGVAREIGHVAPYPSPVSFPAKLLLVAKEIFDILVWIAGVLVIPAGLVGTASSGVGWAVFAAVVAVMAYPATALALLVLLPRLAGIDHDDRDARWLTGTGGRVALALTFAAAPFVSATGPWVMLLRMTRSWRRGTPVLSGKTER